MDDKQVISPKDPRSKPENKGSALGAIVLIATIIGAGSWVYRDFSEDEERVFEDCVNELARGRSDVHAFDQYTSRAQRACRPLSEDEARDLVFMTLLNVCSHDPEEKKNIEQYYRRSLVNGAISFCREKGRRSSISYDDNIHGEDMEEDRPLSPEQVAALKKSKTGLSKEEMRIVNWYVDDGLSYVEIGKKMGGKDWRTAKARVQEALLKMKESFLSAISDV